VDDNDDDDDDDESFGDMFCHCPQAKNAADTFSF
jgi:hypothetical protein